jgi:hypothetical protein
VSRQLGGLSMQPLECIAHFLYPLASFCASSIVQSLLESVEYHPICALNLSVGLWMGD